MTEYKYVEYKNKEENSPFKPYVDQLLDLLNEKNADYKDSFNQTLDTWGENIGYGRIDDKIKRIASVVKSGEYHVKDEPIENTLWDIAGYAILMLRYLEGKNARRNR